MKAKFQCPEFLIVHFDSKIIQVHGGATEDRLAIVFSSPNHIQGQFASSPVIEDGKGASQAVALNTILDDWGVKTSVVGQVFDTTASNTGIRKGSSTRLEKILKRPITLECLIYVPARLFFR